MWRDDVNLQNKMIICISLEYFRKWGGLIFLNLYKFYLDSKMSSHVTGRIYGSAKKSFKTDKWKYVEGLSVTAKKLKRGENLKELYETTKKSEMKSYRLVKNKGGETITKDQE